MASLEQKIKRIAVLTESRDREEFSRWLGKLAEYAAEIGDLYLAALLSKTVDAAEEVFFDCQFFPPEALGEFRRSKVMQ